MARCGYSEVRKKQKLDEKLSEASKAELEMRKYGFIIKPTSIVRFSPHLVQYVFVNTSSSSPTPYRLWSDVTDPVGATGYFPMVTDMFEFKKCDNRGVRNVAKTAMRHGTRKSMETQKPC
jgi:hypothetical protein